jgi:sulfur carrier protein
MHIVLNGSDREIPENLSAGALLQDLGLAGKRLALEINQEIVPRSTFDSRLLSAGDRVEIVQAIGGG